MTHSLFTAALYDCKEEKNASLVIRSAHCFNAAGVHFFGSHTKGFNRIGYGDTAKAFRHMPVTATVSDEVPELKGGSRVAIELTEDAGDLVTFAHPHIATYVFGPENGSVPPHVLRQCDRVIKIPTSQCLNLAMAASIVFYDRIAKQQRLRILP